MKENYIYTVARVRAMELFLLSKQDFNRLIACESYNECVNALKDRGWGDASHDGEDSVCDYQIMLRTEEKKFWRLMAELIPNKELFRVILLPIDYHNLKAAIKGYITESLTDNLFVQGGTVEITDLTNCIQQGNFAGLPQDMVASAHEAFEKLLHTGDGQLCDSIVDKALLESIKAEGKKSKLGLIKQYAEFFVASADIKLALRSQAMQKGVEFLNSVLVECESLDIRKLAERAATSQADLFEYLEVTPYADVVKFLAGAPQKFDLWRETKIAEMMKTVIYDSFSIGPIIAYIWARQNEIKAARIILTGKLNCIETGLIKERLRMIYA